ncbi:hypothetical protein BCR39DRAFT_531232 [Naematelia encephala]|uniref:Uncharacterized protein n=1 Tax=Naematelia encephala TaxID=71784 RepID=A0A1Y2B464_9TREE|nr:hypothetical protein BCR39DRAFT_531232 [Naematelia encephala]
MSDKSLVERPENTVHGNRRSIDGTFRHFAVDAGIREARLGSFIDAGRRRGISERVIIRQPEARPPALSFTPSVLLPIELWRAVEITTVADTDESYRKTDEDQEMIIGFIYPVTRETQRDGRLQGEYEMFPLPHSRTTNTSNAPLHRTLPDSTRAQNEQQQVESRWITKDSAPISVVSTPQRIHSIKRKPVPLSYPISSPTYQPSLKRKPTRRRPGDIPRNLNLTLSTPSKPNSPALTVVEPTSPTTLNRRDTDPALAIISPRSSYSRASVSENHHQPS